MFKTFLMTTGIILGEQRRQDVISEDYDLEEFNDTSANSLPSTSGVTEEL